MRTHTLRRLYVDSNVLINYCTEQAIDKAGLEYLFKTRRKEVLFTSSLAIVQTISNLQTKKPQRRAFTSEETASAVNKFRHKMTIIDLTDEDIAKGLSFGNTDIEDNVHYVLSKKMKCKAIITNNVSDFDYFRDIQVLKPERQLLSLKIK